jgi:ADP-ribose pyrophosphatase
LKTVYPGRLITLNLETARLPDGREVELEIVRHPGGAVAAAVNERGEVCLIRQWRHAAGGFIWEVPAGRLDAGEAPEAAARRELLEEAGVIAAEWTSLGAMLPSPGFCDERLHLFLARGLTLVPAQQEHDEHIAIHWRPLAQALAMAASGEIEDGKTLAILLRADRALASVA